MSKSALVVDDSATMREEKNGFTLVELAIVIVAIGLVVGGILSGQELVEQARIRSQIKQIEEYVTAFRGFMAKYDCVPGDCTKATQFFGSSVTNGDGDGDLDNALDNDYDYGSNFWASSNEYYNFFTQLYYGNFIKNLYGSSYKVGEGGVPQLALNKSAGFFAASTLSMDSYYANGRNPLLDAYRTGKNAFYLVACDLSGPTMGYWDNSCGVFTQGQANALDTKMDDGKPKSGNFFGFGGAFTNNDCIISASNQYKNTKTSKECQTLFIFDR